MDMSISEYLFNPQGKGSVTPSLRLLKEDYEKRYNALLLMHKEFETTVYSSKSGEFYIHVKLPSETYPNVEYDIVVQVTKGSNDFVNMIDNWKFKVVSNSPSFIFTYANVFNRNGLLIDELKSIMERESYTLPPKMRNPYFILGPEKNLYFVFKYIKDHLSQVSVLSDLSEKLNLKELKANIQTIDDIMTLIEVDSMKLKAEKRKEKDNKKRQAMIDRHKNMLEARREREMNNNSLDDEQNNTLHDVLPTRKVRSSPINHRISKIKPLKKR